MEKTRKNDIKTYVYNMSALWNTHRWHINLRVELFIISMDHMLVVYIV